MRQISSVFFVLFLTFHSLCFAGDRKDQSNDAAPIKTSLSRQSRRQLEVPTGNLRAEPPPKPKKSDDSELQQQCTFAQPDGNNIEHECVGY